MSKQSNLERYYYYKRVRLVPFENLNEFELYQLECSKGFKDFLIADSVNKAITYAVLLLAAVVVILTAYSSNF